MRSVAGERERSMSLSHRRSMNLAGDARTTRRIQFGPICAWMPESAPNRNPAR